MRKWIPLIVIIQVIIWCLSPVSVWAANWVRVETVDDVSLYLDTTSVSKNKEIMQLTVKVIFGDSYSKLGIKTIVSRHEVRLHEPPEYRVLESTDYDAADRLLKTDNKPGHWYVAEPGIGISRAIQAALKTLPDQSRWFKDKKTGVLIWNPLPREGESVVWEGGSVSINGNSFANGYGKAIWYVGGMPVQIDEGEHRNGRRHGRVIQNFADGRPAVYEWRDGVKI
ncbi:hypothetical protein [Acetonema longum]|uniref:Uncharacterized protein n=1 Tax=Acetonema longum DSM 6540 TaxID=1009370 RepID=F7NP53_9FIRM|nr:hypothetical protein [Acetonema longum]EGO62176.1 hypothetical protein ALO_19472 [Acetonema longum DSM 6540]